MHELIRTIRAIWSLDLGLITEINYFDIIGLLLLAMYHYQMTCQILILIHKDISFILPLISFFS